MSTAIVCALGASITTLAVAPSADAVPIEIVWSGTVSSADFSAGNFAGVTIGDAATVTVSFDTDQQGSVFGPPSFVGSFYDGPIGFSYDVGGVTESGTSTSFFRFGSDILPAQQPHELEAPIFDVDAGAGFFSSTLTAVAEGSTLNPFGIVTSDIEDVAGTYTASQFDTTQFTISAFTPFFTVESIDVTVETVTVRVIPSPGAPVALSACALALVRRRR
ncbi:MAG: hypothetical protein AAGI30_12900 [Planctomycetota bacterium]